MDFSTASAPTVWHRCLPPATLIAVMLVLTLAGPWPSVSDAQLPLVAMAVAYWTLFRPDALSVVAAFLCGLLLDLITMAPIGSGALALLLVRWLLPLFAQPLRGVTFLMLWSLAGLIGLASLSYQALLAIFLTGSVHLPWLHLAGGWLVAMALFPPLVAILLGPALRAVPDLD